MFEHTSRYFEIETTKLVTSDGREIAYKRRRFIPPPGGTQLFDLTVTDGERLDLIAARTLGDPEQFWRICDANLAMDPTELTARPGRLLHIRLPDGGTTLS
jgi:hypothetical protein